LEWMLRQGDYVPSEYGGLTRLDGAQAVVERVLFRLQARRGALPFLPQLGSQLHLLLREKHSQRQALALRYVAQALEEEQNIKVDRVELEELEENRLLLRVYLDWQGTALQVETELGK